MFPWEPLPAINFKGKIERIVLNRLIGVRANRALRSLDAIYPQPPIGREEILTILDRRLGLLAKGKGQIIRLIGEAGMGKTHVTAEFSRQARAKGFRQAIGTCHNLTRNSFYQPWRDIFYALLDLDDTSETNAISQLTAYTEQVERKNDV